MTILPFGGRRQLAVNIGEPIALQQGAGLHRLTFYVRLDARNTIGGGVPVSISGNAWLSVTGMDWLGTWTTERPAVTQDGQGFDAVLVLSLTDEQLAVIEHRRAGSDFRITLDANVVLGYDPAAAGDKPEDRWPARSLQETVWIQAETWERLLRQVAVAMSLAVVVPVPLDASAAGRVGKHLREGIAKANDGEYGDAIMAGRRAVEALGAGWDSEKSIVAMPKDTRTLDQRLALLRHALHGLASPAGHGDEVADSMTWDRPTAFAVLAGVSALAACRQAPGGP
jgi:hypothetical protein